MPSIFDANQNLTEFGQSHHRRHSQPVNALNANTVPLANLDDIFADFQPQHDGKPNAHRPPTPSTATSAAKPKPSSTAKSKPKRSDKARRHSMAPSMETTKSLRTQIAPSSAGSAAKSNCRRHSVPRKDDVDELSVAKQTGYDIAYFIEKDVAFKYLCIMLSAKKMESFTVSVAVDALCF